MARKASTSLNGGLTTGRKELRLVQRQLAPVQEVADLGEQLLDAVVAKGSYTVLTHHVPGPSLTNDLLVHIHDVLELGVLTHLG